MGKARDMLEAGDFSYMDQENLDDGTLRVTLTKRGDPVTYRFRVRNLYKPTEEVIEEEEIKGG